MSDSPDSHKDRQAKLQEREEKVVNVSKRTTKVNIGMVIGVVLFFVVCAVMVAWIWRHPRETTNSVHEEVKHP